MFLIALMASEPCRGQDGPSGDWAIKVNGWQTLLQITSVEPATGELRGSIVHPTTGKPDRVMGFWNDERQSVAFYRVADSDQADPRFGAAFSGHLVPATGSGDPPRMLVGTVTTFTPGAGASKQRYEIGWYARPVDRFAPATPEHRRAWGYETGWFETQDGRAWFELNRDIHNDGLKGFEFQQVKETPDFIELIDESRHLIVRLYNDHAEWRWASQSEWHGLKPGRWLDPAG